jgi:plastocyanin
VIRSTGSTRRVRSLRAGVLAAALVALSACGSDDNGGGSASDDSSASSSATVPSSATETSAPAGTAGGTEAQAGGTIAVSSQDFSFDLPSEEFAAGEYTIELTNGGSATHDLKVEKDGEDVGGTDMVGPGESASVTVDLEPGEYVFYCSVGNHRAMGMEVTVTVT